MSNLTHLPENILLSILQVCDVRDLVHLNITSKLFHRLIKDPFLWRHLCYRDFKVSPDLCGETTYENIYKYVLHKHGRLLGLYQSQIGPFGGLLEVRFQNGCIEGVVWGATFDLEDPLDDYIGFSMSYDDDEASSAGVKCVCLPHIHPHQCFIHVDERKGTIKQICDKNDQHIEALQDEMQREGRFEMYTTTTHKLIYLYEIMTDGIVHSPLILPGPEDIPGDLRRSDGSFPRQIITPGLFKGTYSAHGVEIILFRYKDENEIHGVKVTGDVNVHARQISVKILLRYPVSPTADGNNIEAMKTVEPTRSHTPLDQIPEQPFSMPGDCSMDYHYESLPIPKKSIARYHGFGQIAYEGFHRASFTPVQVVVFSNDVIGVIWIELNSFSLFYRVEQTFTKNVFKPRESCL